MPIRNLYETMDKEYKDPEYWNPNKTRGMLKHPFRCAVIGSSGSMKTNSVLCIVEDANCWQKIYLIAKDLEEPLYRQFISKIRNAERQCGISILTVSNNIDDVPDLSTVDKKIQNLIICDDLLGENLKKAKNIDEVMIRGRKVNCSIFFISQTFYDIPKKWRLQCNYYILKAIEDERDIKGILGQKKKGTKVEEVFKMYEASTKGSNFFKINTTNPDTTLRFTMNYNEIPPLTSSNKDAPIVEEQEKKTRKPRKIV